MDGMLVHRRVTPSIKFAGTHLYTWVESMARYQGQNKNGSPFVMNLISYVLCRLILQTYVIFQLEL